MTHNNQMALKNKAQTVLEEIGKVLQKALPDQIELMVPPILSAHRIALYGVGREGLMIKSLAMRLYHLGLDVAVVGDMTAPPVGNSDLLIVSAGPGYFSTVQALINTAKSAGAITLCVTAESTGQSSNSADHLIHLNAQTMANDNLSSSILPMGSLYEATQFIFFELLILELRDRMGITAGQMRANHTNLE